MKIFILRSCLMSLCFLQACSFKDEVNVKSLPEKQGELRKLASVIGNSVPKQAELSYYYKAGDGDRDAGYEEWLFSCPCEFDTSTFAATCDRFSKHALTDGITEMIRHIYKQDDIGNSIDCERAFCRDKPYFYDIHVLRTVGKNFLLITKRKVVANE